MSATGHVQVVERAGGRRYYALWRDADGRHKKLLGPAWVKRHGTTARGATKWRAADGSKPDGYLTPADAEGRLAELLAASPREPTIAKQHRGKTFDEACAEWLRYLEFDRQRARSTLGDYRRSVNSYLLPELGADTPVARITTAKIDALRERLLAQRGLSHRSVQKIMVLLHGILKRAKRKGWVAVNASEEAERVTVKRSGDFTVLTPEEVHAVVRAAKSEQDAAIFVTAAFSGLRLGELRALRWQDVDFGKRIVHVRRGFVAGTFDAPKSRKVRSVPMVDQVMVALDRLSRRDVYTRLEDLVFPNLFGDPFNDIAVRKRFYAALAAAGLGRLREKDPRIVFHDLRHTFGTLAVQVFPLSDVKAMMGHESIETTMIYVHHVPQHDAAAKLSAVLRADSAAQPAEVVVGTRRE